MLYNNTKIIYLIKKSSSTIDRIFNSLKTFSRWCNKDDSVEDIRIVKQKKSYAKNS